MKKEDLKNLLKTFNESDYFENIDLHIHSNISDGKMSPECILKSAKKFNMKYISISDHNTLNAYKNLEIKNSNIIIPAAEIDCFFQGILIHILAYNIDLENKEIETIVTDNIKSRKNKIYRLFHLRNTKDVIQKIINAGGIPVLAHPACYWAVNIDSFIKKLVDIGLEGVEVFYPYKRIRGIFKFHSRKTIFKIAKKYNLLMTGGSDCHEKTYSAFSLTNLSI